MSIKKRQKNKYQISNKNMPLDVFSFLGFTMDPAEKQTYGPKIYIESYESKSELGYFIHFLPVRFIKETLLPVANTYGKKHTNHLLMLHLKNLYTF